jgi:hypothetical protein
MLPTRPGLPRRLDPRKAIVEFALCCREPVALFLATRLPLWIAMYGGLVLFPPLRPDLWRTRPDNLFLDGWLRWDSGWYKMIAEGGYSASTTPGGQSNVAFWPLFPLLLRLSGWIFDTRDWALVSFVLNNVLLAGATWFLFQLVERRNGASVARLATLLFLTYPYSFYYSAGYSETSYLFCAIGAFYFAQRDKWGQASILSGIGTASRAAAITVAVGIAVLYIEKKNWRLRDVRRDALWLPLAAAGFVAYSVFLAWKAGDAFAYRVSLTAHGWGGSLEQMNATLHNAASLTALRTGSFSLQDTFCLLALVFVGFLVLIGARGRPVAETVFGLLGLALYAPTWTSGGRYAGTIFPVYVTLALFLRTRPNVLRFVLATFAALLVLFTIAFGHWLWVSG